MTAATTGERQISGVLETLADQCSAFAKRAQPHTVAARLTLADHLPVVSYLRQSCMGVCAGTAVLSRAYPEAREPLHHASGAVGRAGAEAASAGSALQAQLRDHPGEVRSPGRRLLVDAARGAAGAAGEFGLLSGSFPLARAARWVDLAGQAVTSLQSVFSHEAILIDMAAAHLNPKGDDRVSGLLVGVLPQLRRAGLHLRLAHIVLQDCDE